jgi:hypothetical protein
MRINPGHVPAATVPSDEDHSSTQGSLNRRQYVKTIQPKLLAAQPGRPNTMGLTPLPGGLGTGAPGDGDALSAGQVMAIPHQFCSAADAITVVQQPAQITACLAQGGHATGAEQTLIFRVCAPVPVEFSHGSEPPSKTVSPSSPWPANS